MAAHESSLRSEGKLSATDGVVKAKIGLNNVIMSFCNPELYRSIVRIDSLVLCIE
jgi:hypothetical protein